MIKDKQTIKFYIKIKTKEGTIFDMYVNREFPTQEVAAACADCRMKVNTNNVHELLGHMNEDSTCAAAKALGWEMTRIPMKLY